MTLTYVGWDGRATRFGRLGRGRARGEVPGGLHQGAPRGRIDRLGEEIARWLLAAGADRVSAEGDGGKRGGLAGVRVRPEMYGRTSRLVAFRWAACPKVAGRSFAWALCRVD